MTAQPHILSKVSNGVGFITLNRAPALNALTLEMTMAITRFLEEWRVDPQIHAVVILSNSEKAFCAGGDIRALYQAYRIHQRPELVEEFFTHEYCLNHLIHFYPKPYIALLDGVVMGGGMGIAQAWKPGRLRIVTEHTKMAMPEVKIGLFPDVGASYFLSRAPREIGTYLALTGNTISAEDAVYAGLADAYLPRSSLPLLLESIEIVAPENLSHFLDQFCAARQINDIGNTHFLRSHQRAIDCHFRFHHIAEIFDSLANDNSAFAQHTLGVMQTRSPLMMSVSLEQLRRGKNLNFADCLRMERNLVSHCFAHGDILEGIRAVIVDKDQQPKWNPPSIEQISVDMVQRFFTPAHASNPLAELR